MADFDLEPEWAYGQCTDNASAAQAEASLHETIRHPGDTGWFFIGCDFHRLQLSMMMTKMVAVVCVCHCVITEWHHQSCHSGIPGLYPACSMHTTCTPCRTYPARAHPG